MFNLWKNKRKHAGIDTRSVNEEDFSSLYRSADNASIQMQRTYFRFHRWHLVILLFGSGVGAFVKIFPEGWSKYVYIGIAVALVAGILLSVSSRTRKYDEKWFNCRAIAESAKSATWRFMMKACPFEDDDTAHETFRSTAREIQSRSQPVLYALAPHQVSDAQLISRSMINMRGKSLQERLSKYLESRLLNMKTWYIEKAAYNAVRETRWFYLTTTLQFFAIIGAIIQLGFGWEVNVVPILMTCAAASIAWNQTKRHRELAQSYALVVQELQELESMAGDHLQEPDFRKLVNDVEFAISREHTMWCVRREVTTAPNKS